MKKLLLIATFTVAGTLLAITPAMSQVAGTTTLGVSLAEVSQVALGWSVKKSILGKVVYNDTNQKIGSVDDLIISPDKHVSYVIIGAGGFVGIGRHDVAVPIAQIQEKSGKLVMAGATKDAIKTMPQFEYANDTARRDQFMTAAKQDIAKGKARVTELETKAAAGTAEVKTKIDQQIVGLKTDIRIADEKLAEMGRAGAKRWKEFESDVSAATAKVRKWIDTATG